jgi:Ca-activated chloride channel family protein
MGLSQSVLAAGALQPVQLAVEVTGQSAMGRNSRALVLCIDRSGSMNAGNNMQKAVEAAYALIGQLTEEDQIALVSFSTRPGVDLPLTRADAYGKRLALNAVSNLQARGGTHLHGGLSLATQEANRSSAAVRRVVLISDGIPTEGDQRPAAITALSSDASARGVTVTTFGVGSQAPGGLMERVAVMGGGNFRFVRDAGSLRQALAQELNDSSRLAVQDVVVQVELPAGTSFVNASGVFAETHGQVVSLRLGDVVAGQTRHALVALEAGTSGLNQLNVTLRATGRSGGMGHSAADVLSARVSNNAAEVATSGLPWVRVQGELSSAAVEVKKAAAIMALGGDVNRNKGAEGLEAVAAMMERKAEKEPALAAPAARMRALAGASKADKDTGAASNSAYEQAFDLAR